MKQSTIVQSQVNCLSSLVESTLLLCSLDDQREHSNSANRMWLVSSLRSIFFAGLVAVILAVVVVTAPTPSYADTTCLSVSQNQVSIGHVAVPSSKAALTTSAAPIYGFDVTGYQTGEEHKVNAVSRRTADGTAVFDVEFYYNAPESWAEGISFTVTDVTPEAYKKMFADVGIPTEPIRVEDGLEPLDLWGYVNGYFSIKRPFPQGSSATEEFYRATGGKRISVKVGYSTRAVKVVAKKSGTVLDVLYVIVTGYNKEYNVIDLEERLFKHVRQQVEKKLWTNDMSNIQKLMAVSNYINRTTHYPFSDATSKDKNSAWYKRWAVEGKFLYWQKGDDTILNRIMRFQGGITTCQAADTIIDVATDDLGLPYIYTGSETLDKEGVWLAYGQYSSSPSNPAHETVWYKYPDLSRVPIDTQGMISTCSEHHYSCNDIVDITGAKFSIPKSTPTPVKQSISSVSNVANQLYNTAAKLPTPKPVVKSGSTTLKAGTDYTLSYAYNLGLGKGIGAKGAYVGTASVTVTGKGSYSGKVTKSFKVITYADQTKARTIGTKAVEAIEKVKSGAKKVAQASSKTMETIAKPRAKTMTVKWKAVSGATNYLVGYKRSTDKQWSYVVTGGKTEHTFPGMKEGDLMEFRVAAYDGKKMARGEWTQINCRFYREMVSLKATPSKGKIDVKWGKVAGATGYQILLGTKKDLSDAKVITVQGGSTLKTTLTTVTGTSKGTKLAVGKTYYLKVRPINEAKNANGKQNTYIGIQSLVRACKIPSGTVALKG